MTFQVPQRPVTPKPEKHSEDPAYLANRLHLDSGTGVLTWKRTPLSCRDAKRWNARFAGKRAGCTSKHGYEVVTIDDRQYKSHQVVWALYTGQWPDFPVDHINGDRADNRPLNLRRADPKIQARNRKRPANNTSGYIGVSPTPHGTWMAHISTDTGRAYLGSFACVTAAAIARLRAQTMDATYHENHGRD